MHTRISTALVAVSIAVRILAATPAFAQTCEQELARQDAALRQFETDARREGIDFMLDDTRRIALAEAGKRLRGDPTADAARQVKASWDEYQAYVNQGKTFLSVADQLSRCLRQGTGGCLTEIKQAVQREMEATRLANRIADAVQKWIDSLGNEGISRAADRVDRARGVLANFTARAGNLATDAATQGMQSCLRDFDRRAQQAQSNATPVAPRQPPSSGPPSNPKKGMSTGTKVALLAGVAAAGGAVAVAASAMGASGDSATTGGGGTSDSSQIRLTNSPTIQCNRVGGASLQSQCGGVIMLDVGNVFGTGTQVCVRTDPSAFFTCATRGSSSQMALQIDERIVNVDANGNITGCRPTQNGIFVYRGADTGIPATARLNASIPVACQ